MASYVGKMADTTKKNCKIPVIVSKFFVMSMSAILNPPKDTRWLIRNVVVVVAVLLENLWIKR